MTLRLGSLNVDGINDDNKRHTLFTTLKNTNLDIVFLQETHIQFKDIITVKKQWHNTSIWNPAPSARAGGTAILFLKDLNITETYTDETGRLTTVTVKIYDDTVQLINIYGPTTPGEREDFFEDCLHKTYTTTYTIMGGDFNMVEDPTLDRNPPKQDQQYTTGIINLNHTKRQMENTKP